MARTQIIGVDKLRTGIAVALEAQRKDLNAGLLAIAEDVAREIRADCPEDTGALRDSIKVVPVVYGANPKFEVWIGDRTTYYAAFVEFGTSKNAAHPFVRPAVERLRLRYPKLIESIVSQTWARPA